MTSRTTNTAKGATATIEISDEISDEVFDAWNEEREEAAIAEAVAATDVKYVIVEGRRFVGRFPDGMQIALPLQISLDDIEAVQNASDNPVDQIRDLLTRIGDDDAAARLLAQNMTSTVIFSEKFFRTFARVAGAALGE